MTYSEVGQDQFVLNMLKGKSQGVYVEIGAWHPWVLSNTYLLEKHYGWTGVSFEIVQDRVEKFNLNRTNKCYSGDATVFDYESLFDSMNFPKQIDYLQVDIEPAEQSLMALCALPLEKYRFSTITFEHDLYVDSNNMILKNKQKEILYDLGYVLFKENVGEPKNGLPFEDWWIDPTVISYP